MLYKTTAKEFKEKWVDYIYNLQEKICVGIS